MKAFFATVQIPPPERGDAYQIGGSLDAAFYRKGEADWAAQQRDYYQKQRSTAGEELAKLKQTIRDRLGDADSAGSGFGVQVVHSNANDYVFAEHAVADGEAHLGVITSDGERWQIFSDGEPSSLGSLAGSNRGKWFASLANPQHVSLGRHTAGSGQPREGAHHGKFAEVLIYDHPLGKSELGSLQNYFQAKYRSPNPKLSAETSAKTQANPPQSGLQFWLNAGDLDGDPATSNPPLGDPVDQWVDRIGSMKLLPSGDDMRPTLSTLGAHQAPAVDFDADFLRGDVTSGSFIQDRIGSIVVIYSARHQHEGYGF